MKYFAEKFLLKSRENFLLTVIEFFILFFEFRIYSYSQNT
jgi:hypothetical protein